MTISTRNFPLPASLLAIVFAVSMNPGSALAQNAKLKDVSLGGCVVKLIKQVDVPAEEAGKLKTVFVKENDAIENSQMLAQIDDTRSQRMLAAADLKRKMAKKKSDDPNELKSADAKARLMATEFKTQDELWRKGSATKRDRDRARLNMEVSNFDFLAQQNAQSVYEMEVETESVNVEAAKDSIQRHKVIAPISGHVLKIEKEAGEWVNAGETIMTIAPLNRLRIQTAISASEYNPADVAGKNVTVSLEMARDRVVEFKGKVVRTGLEIGGISLPTFMVYAEIENRFENNQWLLLPGSKVTMTIHLATDGGSVVGREFSPLRSSK